MKHANNSRKRGPQMRQRVTQKHTLRNIVIASSILVSMAVAFFVINLSNNESSYADNVTVAAAVNYRSVDTHLPERMLIRNGSSNRTTNQDYKMNQNPHDVNLISRSEDIVVKKVNQPSAE